MVTIGRKQSLVSGNATVAWDAMGTVPTLWALRAGTNGPGSEDLGGPSSVGPETTSGTITGLPIDGRTITISLYAIAKWCVECSGQ
jgi:hypothetical protein